MAACTVPESPCGNAKKHGTRRGVRTGIDVVYDEVTLRRHYGRALGPDSPDTLLVSDYLVNVRKRT